MTRWQRRQWKQTLLAAGAVGAAMGACLGLASVASYFDQGRLIALGHGPVHWTVYGAQAVGLIFAAIAFCIVVGALLPALCHAAFLRLMRAWNGRD